jgi:hypothetical protein
MQPERDHNLNVHKTNAGEAPGRKGCGAGMDGWFDAQMLLLAETP